MINVFISIINFNGKDNTLACLASLEKVSLENVSLSVVVIDNASKEAFSIQKEVYKHFSLHCIQSSTNSGFSGGHNTGIRYALEQGAEYIIILNNDTIVHKDFLKELVDVAQEQPHYGIIAPKIYFTKGSEYHKNRYKKEDLGKVIWYAGGIMDWDNVLGRNRGVDEVDAGQYDVIEKTDMASGCCMLLKKEVLHNIGMFDERYFLYYEDTDLNMRAKKAGYSVIYAPKAVLWHTNAASSGGSGSQLQDYFISRNRLLFGLTYASFRAKVALVRESLQILKTGRQWQKRGIRDYYLRKFGKGSYNV